MNTQKASPKDEGTAGFVWPPVDVDAARRSGPDAPPIAKGFIEPKPSLEDGTHDTLERVMREPRSRWVSWAEEIEEAYLGYRGRVLTGHDGRWSPEPVNSACPRCGRSVGEREVSPADGRCLGCRAERFGWDRLIRLGEHSGALREAILALKYERWRKQGTVLGRLLGYRVADAMRCAGIEPSSAVLVPVPMPAIRRISRGIDHALVVARGVSATSGVRITPMLSRRHGRPQVRVAPSARAKNLRGKIRVASRHRYRGELVVLVDDVKTTGATLRACSRAICEGVGGAGTEAVRIWSAVVAVTPEKNRREVRENAQDA